MTTEHRVGRPPKRRIGKGRSNINFQINAPLRRELVEAAAKANRSLAAQIEWCISYALATAPATPQSKPPPSPSGFITEEEASRRLTPEEWEHIIEEKLRAERAMTDEQLKATREEFTKMVEDALKAGRKSEEDAA